jgi:subtilisin family serine protease
MILKYFDSKVSEQKTLEASNKALAYALSMGADLVNYSGGGNFPNSTERSLVQKLDEKGIYLVAASGNDGRSLDAQGFYPASYGFPHILSVASTDASGRLLPSSNRGKNTVDLAALGFEVFSSLPDQRMGTMTGTSQATAEVTSVLASLMAHSPLLSADQMKKRLLLTARPVETLEGQIKNPLIPDRKRALSMRDEDEFDAQYRLARTRVQEVFDDPLQEGKIQREISSDP